MKNIYIYRESHLPKEGWIQSCFHCYIPTSHEIIFKRERVEKTIFQFNVYLCPHCRRKFRNNIGKSLEFTQKCEKYILQNYSFTS